MFLNKPYKIILLLAIFFYCQFLFFQFTLTPPLKANFVYGSDKINSWGILFLSALIFAPILEELMYRGLFSSSKWRYLSYTLFIVGSLLVFYQMGYRYWSILISALGLIFIYLKENNYSKFKFLLIGYSILIFALSHYKQETLIQKETLFTIGNFLAGSCLLTWIVLNYSLKASILVHSAINLVMFIAFLVGLNNVNSTIQKDCFPAENLCYKLQEKALFNSNISRITTTTDSLIAKNATIPQILKALNIPTSFANIAIYEPYKKYDVAFYKSNQEISDKNILLTLEKLKLI